MVTPRNAKTRGQVRLALARMFEGDRAHPIEAVPAATGGSTTTLIDSKYDAGIYQNDHFNGWELVNQTKGFKTFVTDFANSGATWTFPTQVASAASDVYEVHNRAGPLSTNYDDAIDMAVMASERSGALSDKVSYDLAHQWGRTFYPVPTGFSYVHGIWADVRTTYCAQHRPMTFDVLTGLRYTAASTKLAQSFQFVGQANPAVILSDAYLLLAQVGGISSGTVVLSIETDSGGSPSGTAVATSAAVTASGIAVDPTFQRFTFAAHPVLTADTTYWLCLSGTYAISIASYIVAANDTGAGYAGGSLKAYDGAAWSAVDGDLVFMVRAQQQAEYIQLKPRKHFTLLNDTTRQIMLTPGGQSVLAGYDGAPLIVLGQGAPSLPTSDSSTLEIPYDYAIARAGMHLAEQNPDWLGANFAQRMSVWQKVVGDLETKMSTGIYPGTLRAEAL